jgi:DNA-binding NarL/FixJ family response regulator
MTSALGPIRLFLVDDHPIVRAGLAAWLGSHAQFVVIGEVASGELALERVPHLLPDVVLLDLSLPGMGGVEVAAALHRLVPQVRLVALSMHEEVAYVEAFLAAGGSGYVPKSALETQLVDALSAVMRSERYAPPALLELLAANAERHLSTSDARLSARELEVVKGIAQGSTYREIAAALAISEKTVATYRERAAGKLGVTHRAALVRWALETNLLD